MTTPHYERAAEPGAPPWMPKVGDSVVIIFGSGAPIDAKYTPVKVVHALPGWRFLLGDGSDVFLDKHITEIQPAETNEARVAELEARLNDFVEKSPDFLHLERAAELLRTRPTTADGLLDLYEWMNEVEEWKTRDQALREQREAPRRWCSKCPHLLIMHEGGYCKICECGGYMDPASLPSKDPTSSSDSAPVAEAEGRVTLSDERDELKARLSEAERKAQRFSRCADALEEAACGREIPCFVSDRPGVYECRHDALCLGCRLRTRISEAERKLERSEFLLSKARPLCGFVGKLHTESVLHPLVRGYVADWMAALVEAQEPTGGEPARPPIHCGSCGGSGRANAYGGYCLACYGTGRTPVVSMPAKPPTTVSFPALPIDTEDERIVDELIAKRTAKPPQQGDDAPGSWTKPVTAAQAKREFDAAVEADQKPREISEWRCPQCADTLSGTGCIACAYKRAADQKPAQAEQKEPHIHDPLTMGDRETCGPCNPAGERGDFRVGQRVRDKRRCCVGTVIQNDKVSHLGYTLVVDWDTGYRNTQHPDDLTPENEPDAATRQPQPQADLEGRLVAALKVGNDAACRHPNWGPVAAALEAIVRELERTRP